MLVVSKHLELFLRYLHAVFINCLLIARSPNEDYDNFVKFVTTTMQALGGSFHRSAVYNFLSCYWKRLTDVLLSPAHSGLPRCLRQNEERHDHVILAAWIKKRSNFTLIFRIICIYIYMYIHQTWHGIDMSFPPVPFGKPEPFNLPGSSPYDPEIRSTLDGTKGFRRNGSEKGYMAGNGNPTRISNMGVSKNRCTPKSSIFIGFSIIFTIHFGVPLFLETPIYIDFQNAGDFSSQLC